MENIRVDMTYRGLTAAGLGAYREQMQESLARLRGGEMDFTGWVKLPAEYDRREFEQIKRAAQKIKEQSELLIVVGIGGSYLGARAVIEALAGAECANETSRAGRTGGEDCAERDDRANGANGCPKVVFAGNNMSGAYHARILHMLKSCETSVCVISKSGTTAEPSIAFAILKEAMIEKYGRDGANRRIYAITDKSKGILRREADEEGYESFIVPDDIGGRYSVLSPVGLLPIEAAGIDTQQLLAGARAISAIVEERDYISYAAARRFLADNSRKQIEIFEYYEPQLQYFAEWLKQLFGESEGKDGKGIFPASLSFSADLHSMGQFLQEGNQIFFETVLNVCNPPEDITVPQSAGGLLAGRSLNEVNRAALQGVIAAHRAADIPVIKIDIPELTPFHLGQLIYFFETCCAVSCMLAGVDPFNQPGVESYKAEMKKELQK